MLVITATPEEIKSGGKGMQIQWGISKSPFGNLFLAKTPKGISHLSFFDDNENESLEVLKYDWPNAILTHDDKPAVTFSKEILYKQPTEISLFLKGTEFQLKVWKGLLEIPNGTLITYGSLAEKIGMNGSARAVGNAVGRNRISYLIPCHRVVRRDGTLGGYRWGKTRKQIMLDYEKSVDRSIFPDLS